MGGVRLDVESWNHQLNYQRLSNDTFILVMDHHWSWFLMIMDPNEG